MNLKKALIGSTAVAAAFASASAMAQPTLSDVIKASGAELDGYMSGGYNYNFNDDPAGIQWRPYNSEADSFQLNQAAIRISSLPENGFGGRAHFIYGEDSQAINGAYGDDSVSKFSMLEGFIHYGRGPLSIIGGRFVTLAGAEVIEDRGNSNISRSLLFTMAQPSVHTGVRASYAVSDMLTAHLGVNNSAVAGAADDNNEQKTVEVGLGIQPSSNSNLAVSYYDGVESNNGMENLSVRFIDVVGSVQVNKALELVLNYDFADFEDSSEISGFAAYVNYQFCEQLRASLRGEFVTMEFDNGAPDQDVNEVTLTFGYRPMPNFELQLEGRIDNADDGTPFTDGADMEDSQTVGAIRTLFTF